LLQGFGFQAEKHPVPVDEVKACGLQSITNLIVRRPYGAGPTIALNAHGDVVPPGEGWTHDPYGGEVVDGKLYGRASAVSKCDFSTYTFAVRALESLGAPLEPGGQPLAQLRGGVELHFTYDEEFGGELGPGWLLKHKLTKPDLLLAAAFSYQVVTAHNGCLQMEITVHGKMGHAAVPDTAVDALQAATQVLNALYHQNTLYRQVTSRVAGITHPYLNVGQIEGGTNTNVVPGKVVLKIDRRMIPEENPAEVETTLRRVITEAVAGRPGVSVDIKRILLAHSLKPLPGNQPLVDALCRHASEIFGEPIGASGTPLYTDARLYCEQGIPAALYGCGPRTVLESNAKRSDEHIELEDLRRATKVVARTLFDLLH
jgi:acetylornithine deacetylase/succinyl-diaminopimelate desuccinylase-like protein